MHMPKGRLGWFSVVCLALLSACGGGGDGNAPAGPGTIQLAGTAFDVSEGQVANIIVIRSGGNAGAVSVDYAFTDGTAVAGSDYEAVSPLTGTITFANQTGGNTTIAIRAIDDNTAEGPESLTLTLSNISGGATLGPHASATIRIIDNDTAAVSAFGPIAELNSATVNGIRYNTDATNVNINGLPVNVSDLKLGQLVTIEGDVNFSTARGTANQIDYSATIIGPVEHIDSTLERLLVMGQTVLSNADTVFDAAIDPDTFAGLALGATTQVSGFQNADGDIMATRIELDTTSTEVQLIGTVASLDVDNRLFSINRLTVDYGSATMNDLPAGIPTDGLLVMVRGLLTNGILVVNEIESVIDLTGTAGERVHVGGLITRFVSATDFDLNGVPMTTNARSVFEGGVAGDLEANVEITVDGEVSTAGDVVVANEVTIGRPVDDRPTATFDFEHFTNISVRGLSKVTVEQGLNFSVEVLAPRLETYR